MTDEPSKDESRSSIEGVNWPTWFDDYQKRRELEQQRVCSEFRQTTLPTLQSLGIEKVVGGYSGYGDSGDLHDLDCYGPEKQPVEIDPALRRQCVDFLYEFLPDGYEINDGGQGNVTLNLQTMRVELEHEENYTETRSSYEEFEF